VRAGERRPGPVPPQLAVTWARGRAWLLLTGVDCRNERMAGRYQLIHRTPTQADLNAWAFDGLTQAQLDVVFESSDDFFLYGG
jgi:hypothetical protein